jgi:acetylornithine deacetylase/succinyl-diaminopimelate desuccinylase
MANLKQLLDSMIDQEALYQLTEELISIPSYTGVSGQETEVAKHLRALFEREGIECTLDPVQDGRCNVTAVLHGSGGGRSLLLCGHTDTVPPYDMENAFIPRREDGRITGRGASDMKGPVAAMAWALIAVKRAGIPLKGDLRFAGVIDEECRSLGTVHLLEQGVRADAAIVGEPSESKLCIAHRGLEWFEFDFQGKTVHGGRQAEGINAISKAARFILAVEDEMVPELSKRTHPVMGSATVNVGVIRGGTQPSTVAGDCSVLVDRRFLPDEAYGEVCTGFTRLLDRMSADDEDFHCEMRVSEDSVMENGYVHRALETDPDHPFVRLVHVELSGILGREAEITCFPAWTDAALLSCYGGIPSVVYGPGSMACCHSRDEYVTEAQLLEGCRTYAYTALDFCEGEKEKRE